FPTKWATRSPCAKKAKRRAIPACPTKSRQLSPAALGGDHLMKRRDVIADGEGGQSRLSADARDKTSGRPTRIARVDIDRLRRNEDQKSPGICNHPAAYLPQHATSEKMLAIR